eukprot:7248124-Alexandrium_andersonii.AAC.1
MKGGAARGPRAPGPRGDRFSSDVTLADADKLEHLEQALERRIAFLKRKLSEIDETRVAGGG